MTDQIPIAVVNKSLGPTPEDGHKNPDKRCRLVIVLSGEHLSNFGAEAPKIIENALSGGDVASVILAQNTLEEALFLDLVKPCVEVVQNANSAAIIAGDPRVAGRLSADGIQYGQDVDGIRDGVERFAPKMMIGAGNIRSRHTALIIGEAQPDYVMFGKPGGDTKAKAHPRNLDLGTWWSAMIEIPCITMAGTKIESILDVAETGTEFVSLGHAIFGPKDSAIPQLSGDKSPANSVKMANNLLDKHAPTLLDADET